MLKKALPLVFLLSSVSYAGQLKSVDFLYSSESVGGVKRDYLEITISKEGNCTVLPQQKRGKEIVVELENCQLKRPFFIGRRGSFVKGAKLLPKGNGSELVVELSKPGVLRLTGSNGKVKLKVLEGDFIKPDINSIRTVTGEEIVIDFPFPVKPAFEKVGNRLILTVPKVKLEPSKQRINSYYVKTVVLTNSRKGGVVTLTLSPEVAAVEVLPKENQVFVRLVAPRRKKAQVAENLKSEGPKIALHFTNADVKSVVKAITSVAGINVVFDPDVKGKVNIDFRRPIPWKEALKAVLEPLSLTYINYPGYIRILPKGKIAKEEHLEPVKEYIISVNYVNASELAKDISKLITNKNRERLAVNKQTNSLLLKVTPTHYREILELVNRIDRPRKQVLVKVKIVQLSSKAEKNLGFTWYISGYNRLGNSTASTYTTGSYGFNTNNYTPLIKPDSYMNLANIPIMDSTLALGILNKTQTLRMELALKALEIGGDAQVISSPRVLTLDNQAAIIEQGIEIPYRETVLSAAGATIFRLKFKKASLILRIRPHITSDKNILLDLEVHKDSPNYEYIAATGKGEPAINTRSVKSKIMVHNGYTVVIGGIYEKERNRSISKVPFLSRIPLLGWLFENSQEILSKKEMVIFLTPIIQ